MNDNRLSDKDAKKILTRKWPDVPASLWQRSAKKGRWIQARPNREGARKRSPVITYPGATKMKTQPDGMYVFFGEGLYVDMIVIEVCRTCQNLYDKRSRYAPSTTSLIIEVPHAWLNGDARLKGGGRKNRWLTCRPPGQAYDKLRKPWIVPIRHLRVLYILPDNVYDDWVTAHPPAGHEYYARHSALHNLPSGPSSKFLRRLAPGTHFYTQPYA